MELDSKISIKFEDFDKTCRICSKTEDRLNLVDLFDNTKLNNIGLQIIECAPVKVSPIFCVFDLIYVKHYFDNFHPFIV